MSRGRRILKKDNKQDIRSLRLFKIIYGVGILVIAIIAVEEASSSEGAGDISSILSVLHLSSLIAVGCFYYSRCHEDSKRFFATQTGNRIQSAGYLHTLIGFLSAVALLGQGPDFQIQQLTAPLGGALFTSVLGWLIGAELSACGEEEFGIEGATKRIIDNLDSYATSISSIHKRHATELEQIYKSHAERIIQFNSQYNQELRKLNKQVTISSTSMSQSLIDLSSNINGSRTRVSTSLNSFSSTVEQQTIHLNDTLQSYLDASAKVSRNAEAISHDFSRLGSSSQKASEELSETVSALRTVSRSLQGWAEESRAAVSVTNRLLRDIRQLADKIWTRRGQAS